ncbi:DUF3298 domain-containing protein [Paenibacillus oryzisoli]|uniref:DUF3298 and DUF4163 domain-containing protein n=1 Tax=Paenibacillus oryzisoli TaxID=1850517 RepID=UPI003D2E05FE
MEEKMEKMRQQYMDIPIPQELNFVVQQAIRKHRPKRSGRKWAAGAAAAAVVFVAGLNTSQAFADTLSEVPVLGELVKVLTFRTYHYEDKGFQANVEVPAITNLDNKELQETLNSKYLEESKQLYTSFMADMEKIKAEHPDAHMGVDSGYVVKTDNEQILSVGRYVVNIAGSSSTTFQYDTIDKKNQLLITLPSLFKDDRYIDLITTNIKEQMLQQMKTEPGKMYWVEGGSQQVPNMELFKSIKKDQTFYINAQGKLVIVFQKYEVGPGVMGVPEFVIPTTVIQDDLSTHAYLTSE